MVDVNPNSVPAELPTCPVGQDGPRRKDLLFHTFTLQFRFYLTLFGLCVAIKYQVSSTKVESSEVVSYSILESNQAILWSIPGFSFI